MVTPGGLARSVPIPRGISTYSSRNVRIAFRRSGAAKKGRSYLFWEIGDVESNSLVGWQENLEVAVCHVRGGQNSSYLYQSGLGEKSSLLNPRSSCVFHLVSLEDALTSISEIVMLLKAPSDIPPLCLAGSMMSGRCLLVTLTVGWLSFFMMSLLEWAECFEISSGVHVAEILWIRCDSRRAAPAFAESAEDHVWETCELVPAGLAERSALSAVLQLICRSLGRGDCISLPSTVEGKICFCK